MRPCSTPNIPTSTLRFQPGCRPPNMSPCGPCPGIMGNIRDVSQSPALLVWDWYVPLYCSARSRILYVTLTSRRTSPLASNDSALKTTAPRALRDNFRSIKYFSTSASLFKPVVRQTQTNRYWPGELWRSHNAVLVDCPRPLRLRDEKNS